MGILTRRFTVLILMFLSVSQAYGQDLVRGCIETNGQGQGLDLFVDTVGVLHMSHATRIQGSLRLTSIEVDGSVTNQSIANRIHRFPTSDTLGTGLLIEGTTAIVCYHNQLAETLNVAIRSNGQWRIDTVDQNVVGNGCAVTTAGNETFVAYHGNNQLLGARKIGNGQWSASVVDAGDGNVGELPSFARSAAGQLVVAYRDTANSRLKVALRNGAGWLVETPDMPVLNAGHNPRIVAVGDDFKIFHGQRVGQLDVETDGSLLMTTRGDGGVYESVLFPDFAVGGTVGAAASDRGIFVSTRHLSRSALFGDSDGLLVFSGDPLTSDTFEQYGPAQGRHTYLFIRVALDPFGLPVIAFVDSFLGGFGSPDGSPICYWRPRDTDEDRIPDEIEQELGTNPNLRDTDGDGRSDGQEVLIDGTNPLSDDVCRPVPEVCNGDDDDCDGRTDEQLFTDCYEGPEGTDGIGICVGGTRRCTDGVWLGCEGQTTPSNELCDLVDQDCDGRVDESVPGTGADCDTGLAGICGDGVLACFAGAIRCSALTAAQPDICNGLDDDCDAVADEGEISCGVGVCVRRVNACSGGLDNVCIPLAPTGDDLTCDGADNDCDGEIDERAPPQRLSCGRGACFREVDLPCQNGQWVGQCQPGAPSDDTQCDGIDNDCDGRIDEGFLSTAIECGLGACRTAGSTRCLAGQIVEQCLALDPADDDTQCDGVDSDCDGRTDEDYAETATECGEGACSQVGVVACVNGIAVDQCRPLPGTPDTDCNGRDNDCDGRVDEGYGGRAVQCGIGLCRGEGLTVCSGGEEESRCQTFDPEPDTNCDGLDDDCDGRTDEAFVDIAIECGVGECSQSGVRQCVDGALVDSCDPVLPASPDAQCDGLDNDCDGRVDESFTGVLVTCGRGACLAEATEICIDGETIDRCTPGDPEAADWVCDGLDEDCDGRLDEDYEIIPTLCGVGECQAQGQVTCLDGAPNVVCTPGQPNPDANCNGADDDCDGLIDEAFIGRLVDCGRGACQAQARSVCIDGQQQSTCLPGNPVDNDSLCDGIDSDCDGDVDESFVPRADSCGVGACSREGLWRCIGGRQQLECQEGMPQPDAQCDGLDQDCDGRVDEAFAGVAVQCGVGACLADGTEICRNGQVVDSCVPGQGANADRTCDGLDDDCDGRADEDYRTETVQCGVGACRAEALTECIDGSVTDSCQPGVAAASDETCDGQDDDCDGQADEDHQAVPSTCGVGACQADGRLVCRAGALVDVCIPAGPSGPDTGCDGVDQDCDGQTDEGFVGQPTSCGVGACTQAGQLTCNNGRLNDTCQAAAPNGQPDVCDGTDTDCDGRVDEDHVLVRTECGVGACGAIGRLRCRVGVVVDTCRPEAAQGPDTACDGVDSDCDGRSDEGYVPTETVCGVGGCIRLGQRQCESGLERDTCQPGEPERGQDTCDGIDSDCDGTSDEDYQVTRTWCSTGVCLSSGRLRCIEGTEIDSCVPKERWGRDSTCDAIDADCDGRYDENYRSVDTQCGVGACASRGATQCVDGSIVDGCEPGDALGNDDNCDGIDDDCDGQVDEAFVRTETSCGIGFCQRLGVIACVDGQALDTCQPGLPRGRDSVCDGIDADCDGRLDERFRVQPSECGVGSCASAGETICRDGQLVDTCQAGTPSGIDSACDGQDQDCDGRVDEGFQNSPTRCSTGVCMGIGQRACVSGQVVDSCRPGQPTGDDVSCDGLDNDCDGQTDEAVPRTQSTCGVGACRNTGETVCVGGRLQNNCRPSTPAPDDNSCDGIDSDCNGQIDEDFRPDRITCGIGECLGNGITQCFGGELIRNCRVGQPAPGDINCDGLDDDCDGRNDEDFQGQPIECGRGVCSVTAVGVCASGQLRATCEPLPPTGDDDDCDGLDSDCDGRVDEASSVQIECGVGACRRPGQQFCRDGEAVEECQPGRAADNDVSCDGLDDDCDNRVDEDCLSDAGSDSDVADMGRTGDMSPAEMLDGDVDGFMVLTDGSLSDSAAGDASTSNMGLDSEMDFEAEQSDAQRDGSPVDGFVCEADGNCDDLGGSERRKPIRDGCGCTVEQSNPSSGFIFYLFLIWAIRLRLNSQTIRRNT
ncbi:MAG: hypothetical protein CMH52_01360 [Myxococcales bacterium]|nr:hypothetical protein [Myxococcales bacterium]